MTEAERVAEPSPRWRRAGQPYLLTRDELVAELRRRGNAATARQIQFWTAAGLLPPPLHGEVPLAADRRHRALYPAYLLPVLDELLDKSDTWSLAQLRASAPAFIEQWRARVGDALPPGMTQVRAISSVVPHSATVVGSTAPALLGTPRIPRALQRTAWEYAALVARERAQDVDAVTLLVRTADGTLVPIPIVAPGQWGGGPPEPDH